MEIRKSVLTLLFRFYITNLPPAILLNRSVLDIGIGLGGIGGGTNGSGGPDLLMDEDPDLLPLPAFGVAPLIKKKEERNV